jgi:Fe-Mn family superoxide dismutase
MLGSETVSHPWYDEEEKEALIMFTLPELPYAFAALEPFIDERTMQIHHGKHHATYVKNLNDALVGQQELLSMPVEELIADLSKIPEAVRTKVRNNGGGHANHSLFWQCMAPASGSKPSEKLIGALTTSFGGFSQFQEAFAAAALGRFGSGWVWLIRDAGKLSIIDTPNQDSPLMEGKTPILGLDVWEHAYYLKYQNVRAEYVKQWWNVVNWSEVDRRFSQG